MIKAHLVFVIFFESFLVSRQVFWFLVGFGRWIYWYCLEPFWTFHRPTSGVAYKSKNWFFKKFFLFITLQNLRQLIGISLPAHCSSSKQGLVGWVFTNSLGNLSSIPDQVIQRLYKWHLISPCLTFSNASYVLIVKWSNPGKGIAPSHTPRWSSYWKGSLLVPLFFK